MKAILRGTYTQAQENRDKIVENPAKTKIESPKKQRRYKRAQSKRKKT